MYLKHCTALLILHDDVCVCLRSKDPHVPEFPLTVTLDLCDNHPLIAGDVLRYRDVGPEAADVIRQLFEVMNE